MFVPLTIMVNSNIFSSDLIAELNVNVATQDSYLKREREDFRKSDVQFTETSFRS